MRYENLGPVANADGSPSEITRAMLAGTGRDANAFAAASYTAQERKSKVLIALAEELLAMQDGSVDDAIALLDEPLTPSERSIVEWHMRKIAYAEG